MPVIAQKVSATYGAPVSIRQLFAVVIAFAMLFAPFGVQSRAAMATTPGEHHAQMMKTGHCDEQPSKSHHGKSMGKSCCVSMCAAVAIAPSPVVEPVQRSHSAQHAALDSIQHSFLAELPTPPPRLA